ncbi:serpin B6-like [Limulus polyphemus]|uniref:Serpin B6-like n=1 Tax=Limulus polyphemus TaxID=6850 RepID=A0ABM1B3X0_LIMPO|nr:serpin B6-like [Limulus polyphemus]
MLLLSMTIILGTLTIHDAVPLEDQNDVGNPVKRNYRFVEANNQFALSILNALDKKNNIIMSPWSFSMTLGMAYLGASGSSAREMEEVLGYRSAGIERDLVHDGFRIEESALKRVHGKNELSSANVVLVQEGYTLSKSYKDDLKRYYNSSTTEINFTRPQSVLQWVNAWGYWTSNSKIKQILTETPPKTTKLMLLNGVYFKGNWLNPFNPEHTRLEDFTNENGRKVTVPIMHMINNVSYVAYHKLGVYAVNFPYDGEDINMMVLLPTENNNLNAVEDKLTTAVLEDILAQMEMQTINVGFPKFELKDDRKMKETLKSLGMQSAFSENEADFSRIAETRDLYLEEVIHKAVIQVNENGTEANANTVIPLMNKRKLPEFFANRPFLFLIRNMRSGAILFIGHVVQLE